MSVDSAGAQANSGSGGDGLSLSADGRYVVFASYASNLVAGDTNGRIDVFVRDLASGTTERASVGYAGGQSAGDSRYPSISADGRFVAFCSYAANLVGGDANSTYDVFVRDRASGTTELASVATAGTQGNGLSGYYGLSISADGRFVAFTSTSDNLVAGDTNTSADVFLRDRTNGTTERVSVSSAGAQANATSNWGAAISADGRYVVFGSQASNLVAGDTNGQNDVFVRDRIAGTTERVSIDSSGAQASNGSGTGSFDLAISADGRFVAFTSVAPNLVAGDTNGNADVFIRDRSSGTTERVSLGAAGAQANSSSGNGIARLSLSADGRYVAFRSDASNLVAGDTNTAGDIFVRDRTAGTTERVSVDSAGAQADGYCQHASISGDGKYVAFASHATNLVAGDTNTFDDVFVRERAACAAPVTFCTAGTTTHGCVAAISGTGTPSASLSNGFTISVSNVEGQKQGLVFYGVNNSGFTPTPWGTSSSFLCLKSPTQRTPVLSSGGTSNLCNGVLALDWNAFRAANPSALGAPFVAGQQVFAQAWFRDPPSPKTTNLSNALQFTLCQ